MSTWEKYRKSGFTEMRPYIPGEDLSGVSVYKEDNPKLGDMVARNEKNHNDQWLVDSDYFKNHYVSEANLEQNAEIARLQKRIDFALSALRDTDRDVFDCHDLAIKALAGGEGENTDLRL